jgi:hypothetical protein
MQAFLQELVGVQVRVASQDGGESGIRREECLIGPLKSFTPSI